MVPSRLPRTTFYNEIDIAEPQNANSKTNWSIPSFNPESALTPWKQKPPTFHPGEEHFTSAIPHSRREERLWREWKEGNARPGMYSQDHHPPYHENDARNCSILNFASWVMSVPSRRHRMNQTLIRGADRRRRRRRRRRLVKLGFFNSRVYAYLSSHVIITSYHPSFIHGKHHNYF